MKPLVILLLILSISPCFARIGESVETSNARYGDPIQDNHPSMGCEDIQYKKDDVTMQCHFYAGKCVFISYTWGSIRRLIPWTNKELPTFLVKNEGGIWGKGLWIEKDRTFFFLRGGGNESARSQPNGSVHVCEVTGSKLYDDDVKGPESK